MSTKNQPKIKSKPTKDPYFIYKLLTKYLVEPNEDRLRKLCEDKVVAEKLKMRALVQLEAFPKLIYKINNYLNQYNIATTFTPEQWFDFFATLLDMQNISNTKGFYFPKFQLNEYVEFSKKIKAYYKQIDGDDPSSQEIQALYVLYKNEDISEEDLDGLVIQNSDKPKSVKVKPQQSILNYNFAVNKDFVSSKSKTFDGLSEFAKQYTKTCLEYIRNRKHCYACELNRNQKVILDTNIENETEEADVVFVGYHSCDTDTNAMLPMSGKPFELFRDMLDAMIIKYPHIKYACFNIVLCCATSDKSITKPDGVITKCREISNIIISNLKPKIVMAFGDKAMKWFNIKGPISKNNGQLFGNVIPTVAPESLQYNSKNKTLFESAWTTLFSTIDNITIKKNAENPTQVSDYNLSPESIVTKMTSDLTVFDVKELKDKLVYILKDKDGNKKYYFEPIRIPVYIKLGEYKDCNFITTEMDQVAYLNSYQLSQLNKKIYADMQSLTRK